MEESLASLTAALYILIFRRALRSLTKYIARDVQCSAAMTQGGGFVGVVQSAAAAAGRTITLLKTVGPAADHVTNPCYPEGAYLTGAFFYVV